MNLMPNIKHLTEYLPNLAKWLNYKLENTLNLIQGIESISVL